jgi:hypothetical protein
MLTDQHIATFIMAAPFLALVERLRSVRVARREGER